MLSAHKQKKNSEEQLFFECVFYASMHNCKSFVDQNFNIIQPAF